MLMPFTVAAGTPLRMFGAMCGRYAASANPDDLVEEFEIDLDRTAVPARSVLVNPQQPPAGTPDHNMAPTKQAPVVLTRALRDADESYVEGDGPRRQLRLLTWGLVPSWAKDTKVGLRMINARADGILDKGAFARAALSRRCLVPAAGWYEWQVSPVATDAKGKPRKQPFFIHDPASPTIAFAGLYEFWRDPAIADAEDPDAWLTTFTIVTTNADPGLDRIHDRQPLVLPRELWADWLSPEIATKEAVAPMLDVAEPGRFAAHPVSTAVNGNRNSGPELIAPIPAEELVGVVDPETGEIIGGAA